MDTVVQINKRRDENESILVDSFSTSQQALDTIRRLKNGGGQQSPEVVKQLDELHRRMVLDNVRLITHKNKIKNSLQDLGERIVDEKVNKLNKQYNNIKLGSLKRHTCSNAALQEEFDSLIDEIPSLNIGRFLNDKDTGDLESERFLDTLNKRPGEIKKAFNEDQFEEFKIDDDNVKKFEGILEKNGMTKFKLIQLNDKYYEREISSLDSLNSRWESRLSTLKKFVKKDSSKMRRNLREYQEELKGEEEGEQEEEEEEEEEGQDEMDEDETEETEGEVEGVTEAEGEAEGEGETGAERETEEEADDNQIETEEADSALEDVTAATTPRISPV